MWIVFNEYIETQHHDEITIYLKGKADDECKIHVMKQNTTHAMFLPHKCSVTVGENTVESEVCNMKCNSEVKFILPSGKLKQYIRLIEGSTIKMMEIPIGGF